MLCCQDPENEENEEKDPLFTSTFLKRTCRQNSVKLCHCQCARARVESSNKVYLSPDWCPHPFYITNLCTDNKVSSHLISGFVKHGDVMRALQSWRVATKSSRSPCVVPRESWCGPRSAMLHTYLFRHSKTTQRSGQRFQQWALRGIRGLMNVTVATIIPKACVCGSKSPVSQSQQDTRWGLE